MIPTSGIISKRKQAKLSKLKQSMHWFFKAKLWLYALLNSFKRLSALSQSQQHHLQRDNVIYIGYWSNFYRSNIFSHTQLCSEATPGSARRGHCWQYSRNHRGLLRIEPKLTIYKESTCCTKFSGPQKAIF